MNNKLALLVAVVLGALSIVGIQMYIQKIKADLNKGKELVDAYVAVRELAQGETIGEQDIDKIEIPQIFIRRLAKTHIKDRKLILNSTTQVPVSAGQIIQNYHIYVQRGASGGLDIGGGFRAVTVKVDAVTGISGMIRPGDFVDVIAAFETEGVQIGGVVVPQLTSTVLHKVKVLATDSETDPNNQDQRFGYRTVTLRVLPKDATRIVHSQMFGKIFLALVKDSEPAASKYYPVTAQEILEDLKDELK